MRALFGDVGFTAASHSISAVAAIALQVSIARSVSLSDYGAYSSAVAIVLIFEAIFIARGGELALRYVGKYWGQEFQHARWHANRLLRLDRKLNSIAFVLFSLCGWFLGPVVGVDPVYLVALALTVPAHIGFGVYKSIFVIAGRLRALAIFEIGYTFAAVGITIWGVRNYGILGVVLLAGPIALAKTIVSWLWTSSWWPTTNAVAPATEGGDREVIHASAQSIVRNAFAHSAAQVDIVVLSAFRGPEAVALYKAAKTIAALAPRAAAPVWAAVRPRFIRYIREHRHGELRRTLIRTALFLSGVSVIALIPIFHLLQWILQVSFGVEYIAADDTTKWLLLAAVALGVSTGWLPFFVVMTPRKTAGTVLYGVYFSLLLSASIAYGGNSIEDMSKVVVAVNALLAGFVWLFVIKGQLLQRMLQ